MFLFPGWHEAGAGTQGERMKTARLDSRSEAWGYPRVHVFRIPEPGDAVNLPNDVRVHVVYVAHDVVTLTGGHRLMMSGTCDGLYWNDNGSEQDGYCCFPVADAQQCGLCMSKRTVWCVRKGQPPRG